MKWITRSNVKVDRVACPWLIKRFIDAEAEFLFVAEDLLLETARRQKAIPFDATRHFTARIDRPRGDVKGQEHVSAESPGLRAIAEGFAASGISDQERLTREFPVYDALYEYARH
jgi:hypothetical protein